MKKIALSMLLALMLILTVIPVAFAQETEPVGACPRGFSLVMFHHHTNHPKHHIGITQDLNGDGWVCMRMATSTLHVHADNYLPLP